jgi:hypothetical protein
MNLHLPKIEERTGSKPHDWELQNYLFQQTCPNGQMANTSSKKHATPLDKHYITHI